LDGKLVIPNGQAKEWPYVEVIDPSYKRGLHVIWAKIDPQDYFYIVRARNIEDGPFSTMCRDIQLERRSLGHEPELAIMDARGGRLTVNKDLEQDWFDRFRDYGLHYQPSVETDLKKLHDWLKPVYDPRHDKALPKLRICRSVAEMDKGPVWAIKRFTWNPLDSRTKQYEQAGKDWIDVMRYLAGYPGLKYDRFRQPEAMMMSPQSIASSYARPQIAMHQHHFSDRMVGRRQPFHPYGQKYRPR